MSTQTTLNPKRLLGMLLATVMLLSMLPMSAISASAATGSGTSINDPFIANNYYQLYSVLSNNGLNRKAQYVKIGADFNTQNMNGYSGLVRDDIITINAQKHLDLNGKKVELISQIKFLCPLNIEGDNAQLTIDDSVGGGELSYKTAKICLLGDVNMDGNISVLDVTEVQNGIAGALELSKYQNKLADVNNDGSVSVNDVTQIQNFIAGF